MARATRDDLPKAAAAAAVAGAAVAAGKIAHGRFTRAIGVVGYLLKGEDPGALPGHVRTVAAGGTAWSAAAAGY